MAQRLLFLALAGAIGTVARFLLLEVVKSRAGTALPLGTFVVNITGCFLTGIFMEIWDAHFHPASESRLVVLVGFMGAFTTFSSVMAETAFMIRHSDWLLVPLNLLLQNSFGLLSVFGGIAAARAFI